MKLKYQRRLKTKIAYLWLHNSVQFGSNISASYEVAISVSES